MKWSLENETKQYKTKLSMCFLVAVPKAWCVFFNKGVKYSSERNTETRPRGSPIIFSMLVFIKLWTVGHLHLWLKL